MPALGNTLNKVFNASVNACFYFNSLSTTSTSLITATFTKSLPYTPKSPLSGSFSVLCFTFRFKAFCLSSVTKQVRFHVLLNDSWLLDTLACTQHRYDKSLFPSLISSPTSPCFSHASDSVLSSVCSKM